MDFQNLEKSGTIVIVTARISQALVFSLISIILFFAVKPLKHIYSIKLMSKIFLTIEKYNHKQIIIKYLNTNILTLPGSLRAPNMSHPEFYNRRWTTSARSHIYLIGPCCATSLRSELIFRSIFYEYLTSTRSFLGPKKFGMTHVCISGMSWVYHISLKNSV